MCGIAGFVGQGDFNDLRAMGDQLIHRGPDGEGTFVDSTQRTYLLHRRLAILDIEGGSQPMWNEDRSVGVIFNGEIYNHLELREALVAKGHVFHSDHSDTEVLVHGYEEWGADLPLRALRILQGKHAVRDGVGAHIHAVGDQLAHLVPAQHVPLHRGELRASTKLLAEGMDGAVDGLPRVMSQERVHRSGRIQRTGDQHLQHPRRAGREPFVHWAESPLLNDPEHLEQPIVREPLVRSHVAAGQVQGGGVLEHVQHRQGIAMDVAVAIVEGDDAHVPLRSLAAGQDLERLSQWQKLISTVP